LKTPKPLKKGDVIGLVSTARKITKKELKPAIKLLESWKLKVAFAPHLFEEDHQFAGTDEQRLADLQGFIDNPEIKAILCVRGGYGTVRIIDELNFLALAENPKWIGGYSDVTVLLNKLRKIGIEGLHCSMPVNFENNTAKSLESIRDVLFHKPLQYTIPAHPFNKKGETRGRITGGNLSMLYSQLGSATALNTEGEILFLEDVDEYLYHIDRMMHALKRAGYFKGVSALIVGSMSGMRDNAIPFGHSAEEIIRNILAPYNFPVCFGFPAGHQRDNRALIFGRRAKLSVGAEVHLTFEDGGA
jgi:muramoyltetrapeptide carboxypeptidase